MQQNTYVMKAGLEVEGEKERKREHIMAQKLSK